MNKTKRTPPSAQRKSSTTSPSRSQSNSRSRKTNSAPVAISVPHFGSKPKVRLGPSGSFRIEHSEIFASPASPTGELPQSLTFTIQPGHSEMFPWLSAMAQRFEKYRFSSLKFRYRPSCPTTTAGLLALSVDFDPDDNHPMPLTQEGRIAMLSRACSTSTSPWSPITLDLAPFLSQVGERFVRGWTQEHPFEPRTADVGQLYIGAFTTAEAGLWLGDVMVSYTIDLYQPQLLTGISAGTAAEVRFSPTLTAASMASGPSLAEIAGINNANTIPSWGWALEQLQSVTKVATQPDLFTVDLSRDIVEFKDNVGGVLETEIELPTLQIAQESLLDQLVYQTELFAAKGGDLPDIGQIIDPPEVSVIPSWDTTTNLGDPTYKAKKILLRLAGQFVKNAGLRFVQTTENVTLRSILALASGLAFRFIPYGPGFPKTELYAVKRMSSTTENPMRVAAFSYHPSGASKARHLNALRC